MSKRKSKKTSASVPKTDIAEALKMCNTILATGVVPSDLEKSNNPFIKGLARITKKRSRLK
jgi:hypothetical protein